MNGPSYTDEEGNTMYGFSQVSLDKNTVAVNRLVKETRLKNIIHLATLLIGFVVFMYLVWYVDSHNILGNFANAIASCR